jgi:arylsulfatase A-like enzyme
MTKTKNDKPNILFIMGDDIGWFNISAYNMGMMGYRTPNIDRIANEGALFTDWYAQQSCTAGRAAFLTGQSPIRTGMTKVGLPGSDIGLQPEDPTVAQILKAQGYATGQFGKNHLGDLNKYLPTVHGFDEFFGNLYHLNAEEEPENPDYPKDPAFREKFGPRGVMRCWATDKDDPTVEPRWGRVGKQKIENTGPLPIERMKTVDEEFLGSAKDFINRKTAEGGPWFCYFNTTRMHLNTHLKDASIGKTGLGVYPGGMVETDGMVGELLLQLDELGIADNTIVVYTTDNGAECCTWPDGGTTPFRGEKATNWEGGFRAPCVMRWPGTIKPHTIINEIGAHEDFLPTFVAAAGEPAIVDKLLAGTKLGDATFKVHLDGFNLMPLLKGDVQESPRQGFMYWSDDGDVMAVRVRDWKITFLEQNHGGMGVWQRAFTELRAPKIFNLRSDPFERADDSIEYDSWVVQRMFLIVPAQVLAAKWLSTFQQFPPRQKPASFSLSAVMEKMETARTSQG